MLKVELLQHEPESVARHSDHVPRRGKPRAPKPGARSPHLYYNRERGKGGPSYAVSASRCQGLAGNAGQTFHDPGFGGSSTPPQPPQLQFPVTLSALVGPRRKAELPPSSLFFPRTRIET